MNSGVLKILLCIFLNWIHFVLLNIEYSYIKSIEVSSKSLEIS